MMSHNKKVTTYASKVVNYPVGSVLPVGVR